MATHEDWSKAAAAQDSKLMERNSYAWAAAQLLLEGDQGAAVSCATKAAKLNAEAELLGAERRRIAEELNKK